MAIGVSKIRANIRAMGELVVIFDLETTGFVGSPMFSKNNRIVQICAYDYVNKLMFTRFINPGMLVPPWSSKIHRVYNEHVADAKSAQEVFDELTQCLRFADYGKVTMVAHNSTWFDEIMLRKECAIPANVQFWDTLPFFKARYPGKDSYNLGKLYKEFTGKDLESAHRADIDVLALTELYVGLVDPVRRHIRPRSSKSKHDEVMDECLVSIKHIGPARALMLFLEAGCETVSDAKNLVKRFWADPKGFDRFLRDTLNVFDVTARMYIHSQLRENSPIWSTECIDTLACGCLEDVEHYVSVRFAFNCNKNRCVYERGLIKCFNANREEV